MTCGCDWMGQGPIILEDSDGKRVDYEKFSENCCGDDSDGYPRY